VNKKMGVYNEKLLQTRKLASAINKEVDIVCPI
jgi:hypothetical protein